MIILSEELEDAVSYRTPIPVSKILWFKKNYAFPICPRCNVTLDREYQSFCDRCGQRLDWKKFSKAEEIKWSDKNCKRD